MSDVFLLNLERIFIYIRSDLKRSENRQIILLVINVIDKLQCSNEELCLCINSYIKLYNEQTTLCGIDDESISKRLIFKQFLIDSLLYLLALIDNNEYEKAYDVIDILHAIPNVININHKKSKKDFYMSYIKKFNHKWKDKFFIKMKPLFR